MECSPAVECSLEVGWEQMKGEKVVIYCLFLFDYFYLIIFAARAEL